MDIFWKKKGWEKEDRHLKALLKSPFRRTYPNIECSPGLQTIRGPRQVGKSSWLKSLLSRAVKGGAECFFYSCEEVSDFKELSEILRPFLKRRIIFLDEISFVDGWDRTIKHLIDKGFEGSIMVTGSNAFDLRRGADRMPGRWAKGQSEHVLMPMSPLEWQEMRKKAQWPSFQSWKETLESYFVTGGFPIALCEAGPKTKVPIEAKQTYLRWLVGDVLRRGKQEIYLKELLGQIALTMGTPISLQKLAQKTQMMSYHTAQEYISVLEDCFALRTLYCIDADTSSLRYKKEKKFYFTDPLIYWIALEWAGVRKPEFPSEKIAEMVAHEFLSSKKERMGYYHSGQKGEIDFLSPHEWAVEVKWAPIPKNISRAFLDLAIPKKTVWSQANFLEE